MKKHLPNLITCLNLVSGCISIVMALRGNIETAALLIILSAVFDFFDGFTARLLHAKSTIGVDLDSLADVVSFGVAPAFMLFGLIKISHGLPDITVSDVNLLPFVALIVPLFTALRLAKFNIDTRQTESFIGLPSPASGLLLASLPLVRSQLYEGQSLFYMVVTNAYFYVGIGLLMSFLMVSELPLFGLKFKSFALKGNEVRYFFLLSAIILIIALQFVAIPFIILLYLLLSLIVFLTDIQNV